MEGRPGGGQIGILGPVELMGEELVPLGGVKERCLLAALAVHCGAAVSAASLVDALWGDDPPRPATKTLQNYVLRVRRALAQAKGATIATLPDGYCLRAAPDAKDATDAGLAAWMAVIACPCAGTGLAWSGTGGAAPSRRHRDG